MHFRAGNLCYRVSVIGDRGNEKIFAFANGHVLEGYPVNPRIGLWCLSPRCPIGDSRPQKRTYHASGGNPAANASYTTLAFVADRFVVVQRREHA
mgnify:CR=1 FL=1